MIRRQIIIMFAVLSAVLLLCSVPGMAEAAEIHDGDIDIWLEGSDDPDNPLVVTVMDPICRVITTEDEPNEEIPVYGHVKLVGRTGNETLYNGDPALNLITVTEGASLTIENLHITADTTSAIIVNETNATLNLGGGSILAGSESTSYGGAIRNLTGGTVNINGGIIRDCHAQFFGGGIYNSGTVNMNSGSIINCNSSGYHVIDDEFFGGLGGGISNTGTVNINGGSIIDCDAAVSGGGICSFSYGDAHAVVNINGGVITGCDADQSGGGFFNGINCTLNLNGGVIYNNIAPEGPNVMSQLNSTINITGGMFTLPIDYISYGDGNLEAERGIVYGQISDSNLGLTVTDLTTNESIEISDNTRMLMANRRHTLVTSIGGQLFALMYDNGEWKIDLSGYYTPTETLLSYNFIRDSVLVLAAEPGLYTLIFAAYDRNGVLEGFKTQFLPFIGMPGSAMVELKNINLDTDSSDTIKIMLWHGTDISDMQPACSATVKQGI